MTTRASIKKRAVVKKNLNFLVPTATLPASRVAATTQKAQGKTLDILKKAGIRTEVNVVVADTKSTDANMKTMLKGFSKMLRTEAKEVKKRVEGTRSARKSPVHA